MKKVVTDESFFHTSQRKKVKRLFTLFCLLVLFSAALPFCMTNVFCNSTTAKAVASQSENSQDFAEAAQQLTTANIRDDVFNVVLSGTTRKGGVARFTENSATDFLQLQHNFLTISWRELNVLKFSIKGENTSSEKMASYKLNLQYVKTDNLSGVIWSGATKTLTSDTVKPDATSYSNTFDFKIDGVEYNGQVFGGGYGYGLYHFTFSYSFASNGQVMETSLPNGFFVAVLPDDAKDIVPQQDIRILHSTSYSQFLLNKFTFSLSDSNFDYIKPEYLQWDVTGTDNKGVRYCLTETAQKQQPLLANHIPLYSSLNTTGNTFVFDSNGIEGTWTVTCTIKNNDGSTKMQLVKGDLTTSKTVHKTFDLTLPIVVTLAIILCAFAVMVVVLAIQLYRQTRL